MSKLYPGLEIPPTLTDLCHMCGKHLTDKNVIVKHFLKKSTKTNLVLSCRWRNFQHLKYKKNQTQNQLTFIFFLYPKSYKNNITIQPLQD